MKVAIIGAGNIALAHRPAIKAIDGAQIVGVCDKNPLRAQSTASQLDAAGSYTDADTMIRDLRPDVVHILTPPETHYELSKLAMQLCYCPFCLTFPSLPQSLIGMPPNYCLI